MPPLRAASSLREEGGAGIGLRFVPFDKLRDPISFAPHYPSKGSGTKVEVSVLYSSTCAGTNLEALLLYIS
jgi:hypothetical protein